MVRLWQLQMKFRHLLDRLGIKKIKRNVVRGAFDRLWVEKYKDKEPFER